jgi:hypothetical protein
MAQQYRADIAFNSFDFEASHLPKAEEHILANTAMFALLHSI